MPNIGDKIVHPLHGAGIIKGIEERNVLGKCQKYYVLSIPTGDMQVMVPCCNVGEMGLREVISSAEAKKVVEWLSVAESDMSSNWNKRYRDNLLKIRSGSIEDIAMVVKGLMVREHERGLSTGERKMLVSAKNILFSELVLALDISREELEEIIEEKIFSEL